MVAFIARMIEKARKISLEEGRSRYKAYFVRTNLYLEYKDDVDAILVADGYGDCIVE